MTTLPDFQATTVSGVTVNRASLVQMAPILLVLLRGLG